MNSTPYNTDVSNEEVPLSLSERNTLPFPSYAASRLAEQRSSRYDEIPVSIDVAQQRLRELASIMGMMIPDDDMPSAA